MTVYYIKNDYKIMKNNIDFPQDFEKIGDIISFSTLLILDLNFINKQLNKGERIQFERFSILKMRMKRSLEYNFILLLCVLFSNNRDEKYRLSKYINILINNYSHFKWHNKISVNDLKKFSQILIK